jgi:hypothetical protein
MQKIIEKQNIMMRKNGAEEELVPGLEFKRGKGVVIPVRSCSY